MGPVRLLTVASFFDGSTFYTANISHNARRQRNNGNELN